MRRCALVLTFAALAAWAAPAKPQVTFTTSLGSFTVELEPEAAPATVANFLYYVRHGQYPGTTFHRVIPTFMVQGGGITAGGTEKAARAPVRNEARQAAAKGLRNVRGSIAMARRGDPDSATCQFYVNVVDNPGLDYPSPDGYGYCVFGRVVKGMDTVDRIRAVPTGPGNQPLTPVLITAAAEVKAGS